jgi:hypothetical protein
VFSVTVFTALLSNVFQQGTFLCFPANVLAHLPPTLLTAVSELYRNGSWSSIYSYSPGLDRTENTASNSCSIVGRRCYTPGPHGKHHIKQHLLHCCVLHSRFQTMDVSLAPQFLLSAGIPQYGPNSPYGKCRLSRFASRNTLAYREPGATMSHCR